MKKVLAFLMLIVLSGFVMACSKSGNPSETVEQKNISQNEKKASQAVSGQVDSNTEAENVENNSEAQVTQEYKQRFSASDFPTLEGDNQYFQPMTQDYMLKSHIEQWSDGSYVFTKLCAYNENGEVVQCLTRKVYDTEEVASQWYERDKPAEEISDYGVGSVVLVGSVIYFNEELIEGSDKASQSNSLVNLAMYTDREIAQSRYRGEALWLSNPDTENIAAVIASYPDYKPTAAIDQPYTKEDFPELAGDSQYFAPEDEDYILYSYKSSVGMSGKEYKFDVVMKETFDEKGLPSQYIERETYQTKEAADVMYDYYLSISEDASVVGYVPGSVARADNSVYIKRDAMFNTIGRKSTLLDQLSLLDEVNIKDGRTNGPMWWVSMPDLL